MDEEYTIKRRDDEFKKRKEMEAGEKSKEQAGNKNSQEQKKMTNETAGRTQNQLSRVVNQTLPKKQLTSHQQEKDIYSQNEPDQQVELQEEQW